MHCALCSVEWKVEATRIVGRSLERDADLPPPTNAPKARYSQEFAPSHSDGIPISRGRLAIPGPQCDAHHRLSARASVALPTSDQENPMRKIALLGAATALIVAS